MKRYSYTLAMLVVSAVTFVTAILIASEKSPEPVGTPRDIVVVERWNSDLYRIRADGTIKTVKVAPADQLHIRLGYAVKQALEGK